MASTTSTLPSSPDSGAPSAARAAIVLIGLGALAVGLVASPYKSFDLDRFFVPKELALHLAALCLGPLALWRRRRLGYSGVDLLLALFLALSAVSAVFTTNHWLAERSLAVTWSSLVVFWSATAIAAGQPARERAVVGALVLTVLMVAATSLLQAYGVDSTFFSANRAPGGTLGNRNFVAHLAAIAAPLLVVAAVGARRRFSSVMATLALALVSGVLVLSRTRAAWIALAACVIVLLPGVWRARARWQVTGMRRRLALIAIVVAGSVTAAVFLPNSLSWRSKSPYLDSVKNMADFSQGSGRGRLVQYTNTLKLALHHPLLGVGPGNWAVEYPAIVKRSDPSLDDETGMTANPWPSSDWMAFISERGIPAVALLALALLGLLADAGRQMFRARDLEGYLRGLALAGAVIATGIVGMFDAVLLLPAPALIAFAAFGALRSPPERRSLAVSGRMRAALLSCLVLAGVAASVRSAGMLDAMRQYEHGALTAAAHEDPGSYRIWMRLAEAAQARGRCDLARSHATAALALFPYAPAPRRLLAECRRSVMR
ncbi:MAG: O-antigen ligase family protein [Gemmatimonadaceae bacterium]|nr:O-antigen ligase family protein [Gemmatimonadaceae bacterium]